MKDYTILRKEQNNIVMVVIHTCESPFDYLQEIADDLRKIDYSGTVVFDELLHSGNNDERFITSVFENGEFKEKSFQFLAVRKQDGLRQYLCDYLQNEQEYLQTSGLTTAQIKLIEKKCII